LELALHYQLQAVVCKMAEQVLLSIQARLEVAAVAVETTIVVRVWAAELAAHTPEQAAAMAELAVALELLIIPIFSQVELAELQDIQETAAQVLNLQGHTQAALQVMAAVAEAVLLVTAQLAVQAVVA
jgi:hypothetical protein